MHTCHTGAASEMVASIWLLELGYQVFRNVSGGGPADLTIWDPVTDERHIIDVKTDNSNRTGDWGQPVVTFGGRRTRGSEHVLFLYVCQGKVRGFFRQASTWTTRNGFPGTERYWPLLVDEPNYGPF